MVWKRCLASWLMFFSRISLWVAFTPCPQSKLMGACSAQENRLFLVQRAANVNQHFKEMNGSLDLLKICKKYFEKYQHLTLKEKNLLWRRSWQKCWNASQLLKKREQQTVFFEILREHIWWIWWVWKWFCIFQNQKINKATFSGHNVTKMSPTINGWSLFR